MACSAILYVALLAVWPSLPLIRSLWLLPIYGRPEMLMAWIIGTLVVVGAWLFGRRLSEPATVLVATMLFVVPAVWLIVDQSVIRASMGQWPALGSETWRIYVAPTNAEYAITLFLSFASLAALTASRSNQRTHTAEA